MVWDTCRLYRCNAGCLLTLQRGGEGGGSLLNQRSLLTPQGLGGGCGILIDCTKVKCQWGLLTDSTEVWYGVRGILALQGHGVSVRCLTALPVCGETEVLTD